MGYIKLAKGKYYDEIDVINATYYILDLQKCVHRVCYAQNFICCNPLISPDIISSQFIAIQNAYPGSYKRRIYHIICSLDDKDVYNTLLATFSIGLTFQHLYCNYQSIFAIHEDKQHIHLHMLMNNIPLTGTALLSSQLNMMHLQTLAYCVFDIYWEFEVVNRINKPNPFIMARDAYNTFRRL